VNLSWYRIALMGAVLLAGGIWAMLAYLAPRGDGKHSRAPSSQLFQGIDDVALTATQRAVFRQAEADYERVRAGGEPTCEALQNSEVGDGGTKNWVCPHYRITSVRSMVDVGGVSGSLVGPMLSFEGMEIPLSDLHFVSDDEASKIPPSPGHPVIDSAGLTEAQRSLFRQAGIDYERVRAGNEPTCGVRETLFTADGGSTTWVCPHYRITSLQTLAHVGGVPGFLVGPRLSFDGVETPLSDLHFMTYAMLQERGKQVAAGEPAR
jgi:hypothetical protein